jgi:hypothetical protein
MAKTFLRYDKMVEDALRGVLRESLIASQNGLPGDHHFFITFRTRHPGVDIPDHIRSRYPDEMTIVLQHQYWGLDVTPEWFEVTLSFNRINERLHIPFAAVTAFADPSAKFGLQFQADTSIETDLPPAEDLATTDDAADLMTAESPADPSGEAGGQVIALDAFRKK